MVEVSPARLQLIPNNIDDEEAVAHAAEVMREMGFEVEGDRVLMFWSGGEEMDVVTWVSESGWEGEVSVTFRFESSEQLQRFKNEVEQVLGRSSFVDVEQRETPLRRVWSVVAGNGAGVQAVLSSQKIPL